MSKLRVPLLLALLAAVLAVSHADPYDNPVPSPGGSAGPPPPLAPPPPFRVKGKEFPPQSTLCIDPNSTCAGRLLTCPGQCPQFKPSDPKAKGCFIDCNNPTCEGGILRACTARKPNCEGNGAACFDPRFVGGDGIMFYFHGKAGHHFALVSDPALHINARFIGLRPAGRPRDFTWIQSLGLLFGSHSFTLAATRASSWDASVDHLAFTCDGRPLPLPEGHLSSWSSSPGGLLVERTARVNSVTVTLPRVFEIMASVVPVTEEDNRVHKYGIPSNDCFAHLEVQFRFLKLSERVEGVLGQTYRPDFQSPVKRGVPMPIMGGEDKYATDSLLSATCNRCIFSREAPAKADAVLEMDAAAGALDCTAAMGKGYGVVCRR